VRPASAAQPSSSLAMRSARRPWVLNRRLPRLRPLSHLRLLNTGDVTG